MLLESCPSCKSGQKKFPDIETFIATANAPSHPIRNQLLRLTAECDAALAPSNLFAVIKQEGRA